MNNLITLWQDTGLYQLQFGQFSMMVICLGLLFLAIRKGFEPLLLVPIGFGGLMANIPGAGLAISSIEAAITSGSIETAKDLASIFGVSVWESTKEIVVAYENAAPEQKLAAKHYAEAAGFSNGMLYNFYSVAIASGVAPLLIFMGVGSMTDFGPLLANPKTLFLWRCCAIWYLCDGIGCGSLIHNRFD